MATPASTIIGQARIAYPDISPTGNGLDLFNVVHNEILCQTQIQTDIETFSSLVAGTQLYSLAVTARKVWSAVYYRTATAGDCYPLVASSVEELEAAHGTFVNDPNGTPTKYFIRPSSDGTLQLGLYPTPDTSSSAGYPKVVLRVSRGATLTVNGNLPLGVNSYWAWVTGIMAKWAELKRDPTEAGQRFQQYKAALADLQNFAHSLMVEAPSRAIPNYSWRRRTRQ